MDKYGTWNILKPVSKLLLLQVSSKIGLHLIEVSNEPIPITN